MPDSREFLVSLDVMGNQFGLACGRIWWTGDFGVTRLRFYVGFVGKSKPRAREVVLVITCSEKEEQILSRRGCLVLSYEKEGFEDKLLTDPRLVLWDAAAPSSMFTVPRCE